MAYRVNIYYTHVCCDVHTVIHDVNMSVFDDIIILYGAVIDFADVTEKETLLWDTTFASAVHWRFFCFSTDK